MKDVFEVLDQLYKKVLLGATLEKDNQDYVFYLNPALSDQDGSAATFSECSHILGVQGQHQASSVSLATSSVAPVCQKSHCQRRSARERKLLQLTVIKVMVTRVLAAGTEFHAKNKYREIIKILVKSSDIDSTLTGMFQNQDKLLAHMAANCLALLLYFQLKEEKMLSNSWIAFCQKNLSEYSARDEVACCLCTLTVVIKELFKDTCSQKTEILKQLLTPFDAVFEGFYNSIFSQRLENHQDPSKAVNSLISFLELLELLTASRIHLELHCTCQRIFFLKPSRVLDVLTWPTQAFVKRKFIIFIKKCLLWKVGEDLCRGPTAPFILPDRHLEVDMLALADAVLQAVNLGLLRTLSVQGKPGFGGGELPQGCVHVPGLDHVILRAASLLVIKSLEIKFQNCASANEMQVDSQRFMSELLTFLKPHLQSSLWSHHPCEWLSRIFIEQDDDMLEAAKASMVIYLRLTRYLKLLQKDWDEFINIGKCFDITESNNSLNVCGWTSSLDQDGRSHQMGVHPLAALGSHRRAHPCVSWAPDASSEPPNQVVTSKETQVTLLANHVSPPQTFPSLVDYDSSDDSEVEFTDSGLADGKQTFLYPEATKEIQDTVGTSGSQKEHSLELQSRPLVPKEPNAPVSVDCDVAQDNIVSEVGISYRTVKCFDKLQGAISRLQKKNLFPYNPTALLKLLKQIEAIANKRMNPL